VKVRFTARADGDFEEIGDWIAQDDPQQAARFVRELRKAAAALSRYPRRYPVVPGTSGELRKKLYRDYLIFYRVHESEVQILRICHGSRDWAAIFNEA
jgi:plasmid stabilization system protein ParE